MKYPLLLLNCFLFFVSCGYGQSILRFTEFDDDDHVIKDSTRAIAAFDINSSVEINIEKSALRKALFDQMKIDPFSKEILSRISELQNVAEEGLLALIPLQDSLLSWLQTPDTLRNVGTLQPVFGKIGNPALRIINRAPPGTRLRNELNRQLANIPREAGIAGTYRVLFEGASREVELLKKELDSIVKNHGVYIQLGAWLDTRKSTNPIHLPGFDTYPEGEEYVVKRWNISLSEEQKEQLASIENLAKNFNSDSFKKVLSNMRVTTPAMIKEIVDSFNQCADSITARLDILQNRLAQEEAIARSDIKDLKSFVTGYKDFLLGLKEKYQTASLTTSSAGFLVQTNEDLSQIKIRTEDLITRAKNLRTEFTNRFENSAGNVKASVNSLAEVITDCSGVLEGGLEKLVDKARAVFTELTGFKKLNEAALELGEEVLKHDIDELPDKTTFFITKTGRRQSGDRILVRVAAGDHNGKKHVLEHRQFRLFQLLPHIRTVVGLIFADLPESETIDSKFQLSASYSILLKKGSRRSMGFNRTFSPGIGLNVAALDFDHDDVPEIGLGLVGSIFRDYIQGGFGYNVYRDESYWFFGLRIPLSLSAITFNKETAGAQ